MIRCAVIRRPAAAVYEQPAREKRNEQGIRVSLLSDEALYGNPVRILREEGPWLYVIQAHGYAGYIERDHVTEVSPEQMRQWLEGLVVTAGLSVDIHAAPSVESVRLLTLPAGALVQYAGPGPEGWSRVRLADGTEGYAASHRLEEKRFGEELLQEDPDLLTERQAHAAERKLAETGGREGFSFEQVLDSRFSFPADLSYEEKERRFRRFLTETAAQYLGVQYRWGGRSSWGIDCSGLVQISYLRNGVCIYRDASIVRDYPLKRLELSRTDGRFDLANLDSGVLKAGDALYFPGHMAMYLEDGLYIHSTARAGDMGVVYNSLRPQHPRYRADLRESLYAAAGLRLRNH